MQALALHRHQHAATPIPPHGLHDVLSQGLVLRLPRRAVFRRPHHLGQRAERVAERAEYCPVDRFRPVGFALTPSQGAVERARHIPPPAGCGREVGVVCRGRQHRHEDDVRGRDHRGQGLAHFDRCSREVAALPRLAGNFGAEQVGRQVGHEGAQTVEIVGNRLAVQVRQRAENRQSGARGCVHQLQGSTQATVKRSAVWRVEGR